MTHFLRAATLIALLMSSGSAFAAERTITLNVKGMTCASCPYMVKRSLTKIEGVKAVDVSLQTKLAVVTFDDTKTTIKAMTNATREAGFPSELKVAAMNVPSSASTAPTSDKAVKHRGSN